MALTYTAAALKEHGILIEEKIQEYTGNLTNKGAVPDYQAYCFLTGRIEGLRMALELCDDAMRKLNES